MGKNVPASTAAANARFFSDHLERRRLYGPGRFLVKTGKGERLHENAHFAKFFDFQGNLRLNLVTMALDHFTKALWGEVFLGRATVIGRHSSAGAAGSEAVPFG